MKTKRGNEFGTPHKHHSKLRIGYAKQVADQNAKPQITSIDTKLVSFDEDLYEYAPLKQKFWNNKWNGMNLKNLFNASYRRSGLVTMNSRFFITKDGKYRLSMGGNTRKRLNFLRTKYNRI